MKIKTALTLKFTVITAAIFLASMLVVYGMSEQIRSRTFFNNLKSECITKAHVFLSGGADARTMQSIYSNNRQFINEVEVAVYTPDFKMLYHDAARHDIVKEDKAMIQRILEAKELKFCVGKYQAVGILYDFRGKNYIVTAAAYDGYGHEQLSKLETTLSLLLAIGMLTIIGAGYYFSWLSLNPIRNLAKNAEQITASDIGRRLPIKNMDEIGELAFAFNALLDRLEHSFKSQKMFVSNVSHELRTPLAALIAELDLSLQKERNPETYRQTIIQALHDAKRMNRLIDGLLNLAKADYGATQIKMEEIRIDELLLDARNAILRAHPDYKIEIIFEEDAEDDSLITVNGNSYLLTIAFSNLIDNNCKYSPSHTSMIQISHHAENTIIRLSDDGTGISENDMQNLFKLFYRGEDNKHIEGNGIGMALAQKILKLHGGSVDVHSIQGQGTTFIVGLPHI